MAVKQILFNTEMVKAILEGRKTQTRRVVKPQPVFQNEEYGIPVMCDDESFIFQIMPYKDLYEQPRIPPCVTDDILWVREKFAQRVFHNQRRSMPFFAVYEAPEEAGGTMTVNNVYGSGNEPIPWTPSIHMPKEAARIFLRVLKVRIERLQDITAAEIRAEGLNSMCAFAGDMEIAVLEWRNFWNSTIKKADLEKYGWEANPWVWVIEFERCDKPEGWCIQ